VLRKDQTCGNVAAASWQHTSSFLATDSKFLGQTQHSCSLISSLLSKHAPLRFLGAPPPENAAEKDSTWITIRHYTEHDSQAVLHSQRGIQKCSEKWRKHWDQSQGDYFEGD
jgi:hypothetical protein